MVGSRAASSPELSAAVHVARSRAGSSPARPRPWREDEVDVVRAAAAQPVPVGREGGGVPVRSRAAAVSRRDRMRGRGGEQFAGPGAGRAWRSQDGLTGCLRCRARRRPSRGSPGRSGVPSMRSRCPRASRRGWRVVERRFPLVVEDGRRSCRVRCPRVLEEVVGLLEESAVADRDFFGQSRGGGR